MPRSRSTEFTFKLDVPVPGRNVEESEPLEKLVAHLRSERGVDACEVRWLALPMHPHESLDARVELLVTTSGRSKNALVAAYEKLSDLVEDWPDVEMTGRGCCLTDLF